MRIERAARFGIVGTVGVTAISLATFDLVQTVRANTVAGFRPDWATILMVAFAGTAMTLMFLFAVLGVFVDRKLEARGLASPEE